MGGGLIFSANSAGAIAALAVSGWTGRVRRHGLAIAVAAAVWGTAVAAFGLAPDIGLALACLVLAGAADMISGVFRDTLWNQAIPDALRGRPGPPGMNRRRQPTKSASRETPSPAANSAPASSGSRQRSRCGR